MTNRKNLFFVLTFITLLLTVTAVSAADNTDNNVVIADAPTVADTDNSVITQEATATACENVMTDTRNEIKKEDKQIKTATKTVEVNDYKELKNTINSAVQDSENDEYIINLNPGTYKGTNTILRAGTKTPNIIINANQQTLSGNTYTRFYNGCNITINDAIITQKIQNYGNNISIYKCSINNTIINQPNMNLYLYNSYINCTITNDGILTLSDNITLGPNFKIEGDGEIITDEPNKYMPYFSTYWGNVVIENMTITDSKTNKGNLTLINSTLNATFTNNGDTILKNSTINGDIYNYGSLTINDDVIFGEFTLYGSGNIISNRTDLVDVLCELNGTYTLENQTISGTKMNYGNLTIRNATINSTIDNYGTLIICDDVIIGENARLNERDGNPIIINDTSRIIEHMMYFKGNYTLENHIHTMAIINNGTLTLRNITIPEGAFGDNEPQNYRTLNIYNSTIERRLTNSGNTTISNSTLNSEICNYGNLTLGDNITLGPNFKIKGDGEIITDEPNKYMPYSPTYWGNVVIENMTITDSKTNQGNLTLINSTLNATFTNNGNMTMINSTMNRAINNTGNLTITDNSTLNVDFTNTGILTISDDVEIKPTVDINGTGIVIAENISKIFPYIRQFTGEATVELGNGYVKAIDNYGNLTILNSGFSQPTTNNIGARLTLVNSHTGGTVNNGVLELKNSTLKSTIENYGVLIISDDTVINESFFRGITGDGEIIINDTQRIADYLTTYNGNFVLENKLITSSKINNGNLTLNNCTVWMPITNNGRIIIDDATTFDEDGKITGTGEIITNNITRILPYIDTINGNYTITDTTLEKTYVFNGNVTLEDCNITTPNNANFGTLYLNNCSVDVGAENIFLDNMGTVYVDKNTQLNGINGIIENLGGETIYEPIPQTTLKVDTTTFTIGETTNITASIYYGDDLLTNITKGKVTFKVNGKTIKDSQGKVIYAKVVNGTATIENYLIPESWNKENLTIEAVYSGSNQCDPLRSEKQNITINKAEPTFTTENITTTVGGTINLTATITDGNKVINTGKVVFKINGKTVKDSNGKVIYAKVQENQVNYEYTLPESYKAKNYTITATLISTDYKLEDTKTLTITKA